MGSGILIYMTKNDLGAIKKHEESASQISSSTTMDVSGKWSMELSDVMFRRTKHFLLLLGLCKHLANLFLCAIKHIYTKKQRTCDGISWLQFFLEK